MKNFFSNCKKNEGVCIFIVCLVAIFPFSIKKAEAQLISGPSQTCPSDTMKLDFVITHNTLAQLIWVSLDEYDAAGTFVGTAKQSLTATHFDYGEGYRLITHDLSEGYTFPITVYLRNTLGKIKITTYTTNPLFPIPPLYPNAPGVTIPIKTHYVDKKLPKPARPNNGETIVGCYPGEHILISSLPALQQIRSDCYFHCDYLWSAPSGFTIFSPTEGLDNPIRDATELIFPSSGLTNGVQGDLTVAALYEECTYGPGTSTQASTQIFYGTPPVNNPTIGYDCYCTSVPLSYDRQPLKTSFSPSSLFW